MPSDTHPAPSYTRRSGDDLLLPFQVEKTGVRGRLARLGPAIDTILTRHDYPEPVSMVLGEAMVLASLFGSVLKIDGELTLQTHTDGPVSMLVASYRTPGLIRGYALLDQDRWADLERETDGPVSRDKVLGEGRFALTIDPGGDMNRYQGIVPLADGQLLTAAHDYFAQSEQIATRIHLAVGRRFTPGARDQGADWRAGGIMIQHLAADGGLTDEDELKARQAAEGMARTARGEPVEDAWNRAAMLLETTEDHELLDPLLTPERLLFRLYHEDGVRVYDKTALSVDCRCTAEKVENVLQRYAGDGLDDLIEDGVIKVRCEFCNQTFEFDPARLGQAPQA